MKTISVHYHIILASALALSVTGRCDAVWITNFTSVSPGPNGSASGVWRDVTTDNTGAGMDSSFVVGLSTDGDVQSTSEPTTPSRIDESFPWRDIQPFETVTLADGTVVSNPLPLVVPLPFSVGASGDFVNIETNGGGSSVVTFNLGASVTNPMLSFSDFDVNTTLTFTDAFVVASQTSNLASSATMVSNNMTDAGPGFEEEAAGSLQFTGIFTELQFTIKNGSNPGMFDRTGFVVSTEFEPLAIPEPSSFLLGSMWGILLVFMRRRKERNFA